MLIQEAPRKSCQLLMEILAAGISQKHSLYDIHKYVKA